MMASVDQTNEQSQGHNAPEEKKGDEANKVNDNDIEEEITCVSCKSKAIFKHLSNPLCKSAYCKKHLFDLFR